MRAVRFAASSLARPQTVAWLIALLLGIAFSASANTVFIGLGDLPGGLVFSEANGVSANGSVVVGQSGGAGSEAFIWTLDDGMVGLGDLPGGDTISRALGVSGDGSTVVGQGTSAAGSEAFRWTSAGGMVSLGSLPGGDLPTGAIAASADGSVVVGGARSSGLARRVFRWTAASGMVDLGQLPGTGTSSTSIAFGISPDGSVIVGWGTNSNSLNEAFRWTSVSGMVGIGDLAGGIFRSHADGVSADGIVLVGQGHSASGREAFRWTSVTGMVGLGDLAGGIFGSIAKATSADGSVVVGQGNTASGTEAFIWDPTDGMQELDQFLIERGIDLTGWTLTEATAVSADGITVVGTGQNPSGNQEAFLAVLLPAVPDISGSWQFNSTCTGGPGGATSRTIEMFDTADPLEAELTLVVDGGGSLELFDGRVISVATTATAPLSFTGLVTDSEPDGFTIDSAVFTFDLLNPSNSYGCGSGTVVDGVRFTATTSGTIETAHGTAVADRLSGVLTFSTPAELLESGATCFEVPTDSIECDIDGRRNDVPEGQQRTVVPRQGTSVTFDEVTSAGILQIIPLTDSPEPVIGDVIEPAVFYEIETTASFVGLATVCLPYPDEDQDGLIDGTSVPESRVLMLRDGVIIAPAIDPLANEACAATGAFGEFALFTATGVPALRGPPLLLLALLLAGAAVSSIPAGPQQRPQRTRRTGSHGDLS